MAGVRSGYAGGTVSDPSYEEVVPLETFYAAEDYHDDYYRENPNQPYCQAVISPKLAKFRKRFVKKLSSS